MTRRIIQDFPILPKNQRVTKIGEIERMGETKWSSPAHTIFIHEKPYLGMKTRKLF